MAILHTDEEMDRRCTEMLATAHAANPNLTQEEENDLVGDFYLDAMSEFFPDDGAMLEFFQEFLGDTPE
jgi:hypothetical protein